MLRIAALVDEDRPHTEEVLQAAIEHLHDGDTLYLIHATQSKTDTLYDTLSFEEAPFGAGLAAEEKDTQKEQKAFKKLVDAHANNVKAALASSGKGKVKLVPVSLADWKKDAKEQVVAYVAKEKINMVVTGSRHEGRLKRFFLGSFSDYLVANCPCNVMVVNFFKENLKSSLQPKKKIVGASSVRTRGKRKAAESKEVESGFLASAVRAAMRG